ncbi:MAG: hypothetical protein IT444_13530 [Phycisphaeraceae bacterium]|nr:hypothetical protein [Phycisphaeraceae bacterium]
MTSARQTIHIHNRSHRTFPNQPITYGIPWPEGTIRDVSELVCRNEAGTEVPAAFKCLNTWPDGSVQWSLLDTAVDLNPSAGVGLTIAQGKSSKPRHANPVKASLDGESVRVGNGLVELALSARQNELLTGWTAGKLPLVAPDGFDVTFRWNGSRYSLKAGPRKVTLEENNPLRVVVRFDGKHGLVSGEGEKTCLDYFLRIEVRAGRSDVKITHAFRNRELPTPGLAISHFDMTFHTAIDEKAKRCFTANSRTRHYLTESMRVDEDPEIVASDTGDIDNYATKHVERNAADSFVRDAAVLHDPPENKPWWLRDIKFRLQAGGSRCVWPYLALLDSRHGVLISLKGLTNLHPKSLSSKGSTLRVALWPEWAGNLAITQGAGRSHVVHLAPLSADDSDEAIQTRYLSWEYGGFYTGSAGGEPIKIIPDIEHVRKCSVFAIDLLPAYEPRKHFAFERKVLDAWIGISYGELGAVDQVAQWPPSGFWHYGDNGLGNNEEMHNLVYFQNYLRTGNFGCAEYALNGTRHMLEVDHCAFSTDPLQNGGQVAHTVNHNDGTAYPSHEWFTEYLFAYALTGDREYLEGAKRACEHLLHWINDAEGFAIISADQREAGQPMIDLTWCYDFLRDERYLKACWKIVREYLMRNTAKLGQMLDEKPSSSPVKVCSYGDYAAWEGMFWLWQRERDPSKREELKAFMLSQLEWRLVWEKMGVHGFHRVTDYNPAAYAYYLTGDKEWLNRVSYPFWHAFRAARWPLGWVHAMYYIKLALDFDLVNDRDVHVQ